MVTRSIARFSASGAAVRPRSGASVLAALLGTLATAWLVLSAPTTALAQQAPPLETLSRQGSTQERTLVFLTAKTGEQQVGGGSLFGTLAANHGSLQDSRTVTRNGFELDIYAVTPKKYGLAIGLEVMDYDKTFTFSDSTGVQTPERLRLQARSFLYTLKGYLRYGDFLPFAGIGTGTYYVSYNEEVSGLSFLDSAVNVFAYRVGFRWLMIGRIGLLVEGGEISAPIKVNSNNTTSTLDLGGMFWNAGLSYVW
jgi:hypothetical protein